MVLDHGLGRGPEHGVGVDPEIVKMGMGIRASQMGAFPNLARNVPFCPRFVFFVCRFWGPERGRIGTSEEKRGQNGTYPKLSPTAEFPTIPVSAVKNR